MPRSVKNSSTSNDADCAAFWSEAKVAEGWFAALRGVSLEQTQQLMEAIAGVVVESSREILASIPMSLGS